MDLSFSERLTNVLDLSNALSRAGYDSDQCRGQAKLLEEEIYSKSKNNAEYQTLLQRFLSGLHPISIEATATLAGTDESDIFNSEGPNIGNYEHATFHKDGQMSTIFKAKAKDKQAIYRIVALKVTHPAQMAAPHDSIREARLLLVARHEHVVPLLSSFFESDGRFVLVFPFLRQDLENLLRSGTLNSKQKGLIFGGLFSALSHVHSLGMIHRDIKPSNILLKGMEGPVYLADFGIAWSPEDHTSEPPDYKITDVGTTSYRPPELLFGQRNYDQSLDIWAAGCVIAEMVRSDHSPVFDAGPLGSELGLIKSIFTTLGTPNNESWPSATRYPDWGKMKFQVFPTKPWKDILSGASETAIDFISRTVCYESTTRLTAFEAQKHCLSSEIGII